MNTARLRTAMVMALLAGAAPVLWAQQGPQAPPTEPATQPAATQPVTGQPPPTEPASAISLNFKDASVDAVLDYLSEQAGFAVVKEQPVSGRITMVSKQPVSPQEAVSLLDTALRVNGYTAIQMGKTLKITSVERAKKQNIP